MPEELDEYKDPDFNGDGPSKKPPRDIVAYNELWSCADLANRAKRDKIKLPPTFNGTWPGSLRIKRASSTHLSSNFPSLACALLLTIPRTNGS